MFFNDSPNRTTASRNVNRIFNYILEEGNLKETADGQVRTPYALRHYSLQTRLIKSKGKVNIFNLAKNAGTSVEQLEKMSTDAFLQSTMRGQNVGKIAIAYTVWSKKKGGGKLIVKEVYKKIKKSNHLNRLVTLSPLTEMASKFHTRNGAKLIKVNETTQNFEYEVM